MFIRTLLSAVCSGLLIFALPAHAEWNGYINDKAQVKYGYMITHGLNDQLGNLRLVCLSDKTFKILLDSGDGKEYGGAGALVSVDSLPATQFNLTRLGEDFSIEHQEPAFWKLIAQMAAGAHVLVEFGSGLEQRYSLNGFTAVFKKNCSWIDSAFQYQKYLELYR